MTGPVNGAPVLNRRVWFRKRSISVNLYQSIVTSWMIPEPQSVDDMRRMLDTAIGSVRRISSELRPQILDELGFGDAVTWQIREFARHSGLQLHMHLPAQDLVRDPALATALFRIVQEALNNVVRHAQAANVWVDLQSNETDLILRVRDDGKGMAITSGYSGMGLSSMRERARGVGGRLEIDSAPGEGCSVTLRLALSALPCMPIPALREESTV